ncbi:hypothetical protein Cfor_07617 [Coptotermes formosanus]|uniref:Motile sperm domain-containing protein 3 n=1 Tax=Coptotermes formosanus TaxID=36987 RepID=A0A6L2PFP9_COPFO|nr:hypothetical protein Cfor_07617 [Coptotermes formosanus]
MVMPGPHVENFISCGVILAKSSHDFGQSVWCGMQPGIVQVPVFVYPSPITFYLEDQSTHKQVLTLYNPYDFPIRFRVLCTAPNKYTVVDPEGSIRPKFCVDIVVRHSAVSPANCNITDKFRIHLQNHTTKQLIGKQDVAATLLPGKPSGLVSDHEEFQRLPPRLELSTAGSMQQQFGVVRDYRQGRPGHKVPYVPASDIAPEDGFRVRIRFGYNGHLETIITAVMRMTSSRCRIMYKTCIAANHPV